MYKRQLVNILWREFEAEIPEDTARQAALRLLPLCRGVLDVYKRQVFDKTHELHAVAEAMFELSVVKQLYQSLIERVFEYAPDESVVHL